MEVSSFISSTQPGVVSPDGAYIAALHTKHINVYAVQSSDLICSFEVPTSRFKFINLRWEPASTGQNGNDTSSDENGHETNNDIVISRVLLTTTEAVHVFDVLNPTVRATVNNGSGGLGSISHADFGRDGDEVMIWTNMGASVCVWDITTGRMTVELKDPKLYASGAAVAKGSGWSGSDSAGRRVFALLTREGAQDVVTLYSGFDYQIIKRWSPPTIDAQGIKWSPNGKWLTMWDAAAMGYKVLIYTADGNLFRTYLGDYFDDELRGLGVKKVEWCPSAGCLAISGYEKGVTLLSTRTFSPALQLSTPTTITPSSTLSIYQEQATSTSQRSYSRLTSQTSPPTASSTTTTTLASFDSNTVKPLPIGCSLLTFSPSGKYLATKDDSMPTSVFVWNLCTSSLAAVLIQHSLVKSLAWSASADDNAAQTLLITTEGTSAHIYLYDATADSAHLLSLQEHGVEGARFGSRVEAGWLPRGMNQEIMISGTAGSVLVYPEGKDDRARYVVSSTSDGQAAVAAANGGLVRGNGGILGPDGATGVNGEEEDESVFEIAGGDDTFAHKRVEV